MRLFVHVLFQWTPNIFSKNMALAVLQWGYLFATFFCQIFAGIVLMYEPEFVSFEGAQESIPRNRFRQVYIGWRNGFWAS
jgi:hypothetical protein